MRISEKLFEKKRNAQFALDQKPKIYCPTLTGEKFHASQAFIKGVQGPLGSGKSTMSVIDLILRFMAMPVTISGIRKAKAVVIRNTNKQLLTTTVATWLQHYPEYSCGHFYKSIFLHQTHKFRSADGVLNEFTFMFIPLDKVGDIDNLKSLECTCFFFNELSCIDWVFFFTAMGRVGRYPAKNEIRCKEDEELVSLLSGITFDMNAPHVRHWTVEMFDQGGIAKRLEGTDIEAIWEERGERLYDFYKQPGGLIKVIDEEGNATYKPNPDAENIENLTDGYNYYYKQLAANDEMVKVNILNEYGTVFDGLPVFSEYKPDKHRSKKVLKPNEEYPVYIGIDLGSTPCAAFVQMIGSKIYVLEEVISENPTGLKEFLMTKLLPILDKRSYLGTDYRAAYDKAVGNNQGDNTRNTVWYRRDIHDMEECGLVAEPCQTNSIRVRLENVRKFLTSYTNGEPDFVLSSHLQYMHDALVGGYKYKEIAESSGRRRFAEKPEKDYYSHGMDALQYAIMLALEERINHANVASEPELVYLNGRQVYM